MVQNKMLTNKKAQKVEKLKQLESNRTYHFSSLRFTDAFVLVIVAALWIFVFIFLLFNFVVLVLVLVVVTAAAAFVGGVEASFNCAG